jgi:hypothetical protein
VLIGCGGDRPASNGGVLLATRSCAFQSFGKGWYLRATRSVGCGDARATFANYFSTQGCNEAYPSTCSVGTYRCRYDYPDEDVERVRCSLAGRLVAFRSLP